MNEEGTLVKGHVRGPRVGIDPVERYTVDDATPIGLVKLVSPPAFLLGDVALVLHIMHANCNLSEPGK